MQRGLGLALSLLFCSTLCQAAPPVPTSLTLVEGRFGKALDARQGPVVVQGRAPYRQPPFTLECWARLSSKAAPNALVSCEGRGSANHWELGTEAGTGVALVALGGYRPGIVRAKTDICDNQWHYLAFTHDGKQVRLFVDGQLVAEAALTPRTDRKPQPGDLLLGAGQHGKHRVPCDGSLDDVRLSSIVRPLKGIPQQPLALDQETIGLWRFDNAEAADVDPAWTPRPAEEGGEAWERQTDKDWIDGRLQHMDTGPFLDATFTFDGPRGRQLVFKGTALRVGDKGEAAVLFDRCQMRLAAGWVGDYLTHSSRRFGLLNTPTPAGTLLFATSSGAGWANPDGQWDNKHAATAPLPAEWARFQGLYLHGKHHVLSYRVGTTEVLESPWVEHRGAISALTRNLHLGAVRQTLHLLACEWPGLDVQTTELLGVRLLVGRKGERVSAMALVGQGAEPEVKPNGRIELRVSPQERPRGFKLLFWQGAAKDLEAFAALVKETRPPRKLDVWTQAGPARWTKPLTTQGEIGKGDGPFVVDTLTIPYENPHKALFFVTGVDFLPDGTPAVCTAHGDVWLVRGADDKLARLSWKRFATGLYQPLGLKVIDGVIHVLERGQLTALHDHNADGEADFYRNVNSDWHTGAGEHSYDTCLETDPQGNFYFFKTGDTETPTGGCLMRVSKDGARAEIFATGFRHPIGLGVSPSGLITGADQEGNWMPSTRVDVYRKGGFYGDMRAHHRATPPTTYDPPLCWLPRQYDNSAGGQLWVPEGKWGPLSGQLIHLSYGRCRMLLMFPQQVDGVWQAGAVDLGLQFLSGVARGRFHPRDGHLYLVGLNGWQTAAARDGCLQRVRYTGQPLTVPTKLAVHQNGLLLTFAEKLTPDQAQDARRYRLEQWNYRWSGDYGSRRWSVANPDRQRQDPVAIRSAKLLPDGQSVFLETEPLKPVMQMQLRYSLSSTSGLPLMGSVVQTIHRLGPKKE